MNQQQAALLRAAASSSPGLSYFYPSRSSEFSSFQPAKAALCTRHLTDVDKLKSPSWNFNRNTFTYHKPNTHNSDSTGSLLLASPHVPPTRNHSIFLTNVERMSSLRDGKTDRQTLKNMLTVLLERMPARLCSFSRAVQTAA